MCYTSEAVNFCFHQLICFNNSASLTDLAGLRAGMSSISMRPKTGCGFGSQLVVVHMDIPPGPTQPSFFYPPFYAVAENTYFSNDIQSISGTGFQQL